MKIRLIKRAHQQPPHGKGVPMNWIKKLFRRGAPTLPPEPKGPAGEAAVINLEEASAVFEIVASVQTDVGCVRDTNEDGALFTRPQDPEVLRTKGVLALVADGMGGCSGGEFASAMAIAGIPRSYYVSQLGQSEALKEAFEKANREIFEAATENPALAGMGTTGVALAVCQGYAYAAYVGDSRIYLIRDGRIYLLTEDHSMVFEMVNKGFITREEARNHEERNVLLRSLGGRPEVEVSIWAEPMPIRQDDRFLLCSDGLHDLIDDVRILETAAELDNSAVALKLIEMAKEQGGYDNITVALLRVKSPTGEPLRDAKSTREILVAQ